MSVLGFTGDVNMQQLTQVYRRLYKVPTAISTDQLLNYFVALALSRPDLNDFEQKSRDFIE